MPALAPCAVEPNYLRGVEELFRRERFPLQVSVLSRGGGLEYLEGIRAGLEAWDVATGGTIGRVDIRVDRDVADIFVEVGTHPVYDCRDPRSRWYGIFADRVIAPPRIIRGGRIHICPENFAAAPTDTWRVAHVVAHEMGHALGIGGHSDNPGDVMFGDDIAVLAPREAYPWITPRDLNTLGTAYCN